MGPEGLSGCGASTGSTGHHPGLSLQCRHIPEGLCDGLGNCATEAVSPGSHAVFELWWHCCTGRGAGLGGGVNRTFWGAAALNGTRYAGSFGRKITGGGLQGSRGVMWGRPGTYLV